MDLFNKVEEIAMMSLFVLYNINLMPLVTCVLPPFPKHGQQRPNAIKTKIAGRKYFCAYEKQVDLVKKKTSVGQNVHRLEVYV
jgi:hypothetical protein